MATQNLGMGGFTNMNDFGANWAKQNNVQGYDTNTGGQDIVQGRAVNVQPTNPNQAAEIASAQANINSGGMTEAQARAQFGGAAIDNALAKGITFGAAQPPSQFQQNNLGLGSPTLKPYEKNPYLDQMAQGITSQVNDNWTRNINPSLRSGAMAAGGFGGSRQGVVEANALKDLNQGLSNSLASLYGGDYTNDRNRALGKYQADQGYNLGMANNNLGYQQLDSNNQQFGANYGLNTANSQALWAGMGINNANNMQNTVPNYFGSFSGNANAIGGKGGTSTSTVNGTSNPYLGALAGYQLGSKL